MTEQEEHVLRLTGVFADGNVENRLFQCKLEFERNKWEWRDEHTEFIRKTFPDKKPNTVRVHPTEAYRRK